MLRPDRVSRLLFPWLLLLGTLTLTTCAQPGLGAKIDITAPKVKITSPAVSGTYLKGTVRLEGTASDDLGITSLHVTYPTSTGDRTETVAVANNGWSIDLPSNVAGGLAEGQVTLAVTVADASGKATTDSVLVYVDNKAPTVLVTSPSSYGVTPPTYSDFVDIKGEAWDASPLSRVDLTLHYTYLGQPYTVTKQADGTNTWSVRFFLKDSAGGPLPVGAGGVVLAYSIAVTDRSGNINTTYYHAQDIYTILNGLGAGKLFPTTLELGQLDQGGTTPSTPTGIGFTALAAARIDDAGKPWANLEFSYTSLPTIQYSNLDPAVPAANTLAPGSVIVGNVIPPANAGSVDPSTMQFRIFRSADYPAGLPQVTLTAAAPLGTQLTLTNLGSSQGFKVALKDSAGVDLLPGQYVLDMEASANGSGTATSQVTFGIDSAAPTLTETAVGNNLALKGAPFGLSGTAGSGSGLDTLTVEQSADGGSSWTTVFSDTYGAGVTSTSWNTVTPLPSPAADGSYSYRVTVVSKSLMTAILYRSVIFDATAPTLLVTSPTPGSWTSTASPSLSGNAGDGSGTGVNKVYYIVDSAAVDHSADVATWRATDGSSPPVGWTTAGGLVSNWTGSAAFGASEGRKRLWAVAVDKANNLADLTLLPATGIVLGTTYTIESLGSTNFVALGAASNTVGLSFTATAAGNAGSGTGVVWTGSGQMVPFGYDASAPSLSVNATAATYTAATAGAFSGFAGTVDDTNALSLSQGLTVQYTKGGVPQGAAFAITPVGTAWTWTPFASGIDVAGHTDDGAYSFTFTATDSAGKTVSVTRTLVVDTQAPVLTVTSPSASAWVSATTLSTTGVASDGTGTGVAVVYTLVDDLYVAATATDHSTDDPAVAPGWQVATGQSNWSDSWTLAGQGRKTLWLKASDTAGNVSAAAAALLTRVDFGLDLLPPQVLFSDAVGTLVKAGFTLAGTATDTNPAAAPSLAVSVDGGATQAVTVTGGAWTWAVGTLPADGPHTYAFTATDVAGKSTTVSRTLTVDTVAPVPVVSQPGNYTSGQSQYWLSGSTATVGGTSSDAGGSASGVSQVYYVVDTKGTDRSGDSPTATWTLAAGTANWSSTVNLTALVAADGEGEYTLWVAAIDNAGNVSTFVQRDFGIDQSAPTLTETSRAATSSAMALFTLTGVAADSNALASLTITENGSPVGFTPTPAVAGAVSSSYTTASLPLGGAIDGTYVYVLTTTDAAGKTATVNRTVTIDTTPPTVALTQPGNYLSTNPAFWNVGSTTLFQGTASDAVSGVASVYYTIDDAYVAATATDHSGDVPSAAWTQASGTTNWSLSANLTALGQGIHTLWIAAYDAAGNLSTLTHRDFGIDQAPPTLTETLLPSASQQTRRAAFVLTGTVGDANPASIAASTLTVAVSVNGAAATPATLVGSTWSYTQAAVDGVYSYTITATDAASKTVSLNRLVLLDSTPPTVTIATPVPGNWTSSSSPSLSGSAQDGAGSGVSKNYYLVDAAANDHTADLAAWNATDGSSAPISGTAAVWTQAAGLPTSWTGSTTLSTEGQTKLWVVSADLAGNTTTTAAQVLFGYDTALPLLNETGINVATTVVRNTDVTFSGAASDSNALAAAQALTVAVDGGAAVDVAFTVAPLWTYTFAVDEVTHAQDGTHSFVFTATDVAGKVRSVTRSVLIDTTPDTATVTAPAASSWTNLTTPTVSGTAGNGSGAGVSQVWVLVDTQGVPHGADTPVTITTGGAWQLATNTTNWSRAWTLSTEGAKTAWVAVLDAAGNWSTSFTTLNFGYDTTSPTLTLDALGGYKVAFSLTGSVADAASSVASLLIKIDSGSFTPVTLAPSWTYAVTAGVFSGLSEGAHTVTVLATDGAGNQSTQTGSFNKDTLSPNLSYSNISAGGGTVVQDSSPVLSGTLTDPSGVAAATYSLDVWNLSSGSWNPLASGVSLGSPANATNWAWSLDLSGTGLDLPDGKYRIAIGATDGATNAIAAPLTVPFLLSRSSPGAAIAAPSLGTFQNAAFPLVGTASDPSGVTLVRAKLASGSVDFSSGSTTALPAQPVSVSVGAPGVFTTAAPHGLADASAVYLWGTPMPVAPSGSLSPSTTYFVKYLTPTTFHLAATAGGASLTINTSLATNLIVASAAGTFSGFHPDLPVSVSGSTITAANHRLVVGDVVYFGGTTVPTPATEATAYHVVTAAASTFQVSTTAGGAAATFSAPGTAVTVYSPTQAVHWMIPSMAVGSFSDGPLTAFTQVAAGSGKTSQTSRDFTLDTTSPTIALTSPGSGTRQVGTLSLVGTTTDGGAIPSGVTGTIQYQVGKNALLGNPASWTNASVTGGAYSWTISLGVMSSFANATTATESDTLGNPAVGTNLWKLPIYFQAVDVAGNVAQKTDYFLILDPDGNIPVVTLLQPSQNGLTYGGQQRITGMASQPVWVHDVEVAVDPTGGNNFPASAVAVTLAGTTVNAVGHPFSNNMALYFAGATLPQIAAVNVSTTTPYFVVNALANSFQVSLTGGGAPVTFSNAPGGVTVSVWTPATLTSTGGSVTWYADVNKNNAYPQVGANQTVSVQARAWNSPTAGGARGTLSGTLTAPLTMTFDSTFPKVQDIVISPNSSAVDPDARTYFSQITTKGLFHVLAKVVSSKGIAKIERVESSPLSGTSVLYDTATLGYGSTATITAPSNLTSGAFPFGGNYQLIITSLGTTNWQAIGAPAGASVGTMFSPTGAGGVGGGQALASDSSGNFNYDLDLAIDSTTLYNNTSGVYSFDLRATDMTSPQSQVSLQNITLNEDNFYPTSSLLSSSSLVGSSFKIQGTATDVGSGSGPIAGLQKVVVYLMRGGAILNLATGSGTSVGTTITAKDMANAGTVGSVAYPPAETGLRSFSASIDDRSEIGALSGDHNGDGFQASLLTNGNGLDWWVQIDTSLQDDGPVEVHYVVWDSAGNAAHYEQSAFISNLAPSILSVDLGTDLNGDGTVSPAEVTAGVTNYAATNFSVRNNRLSFTINTLSGNLPLSYSIKYGATELNGTMVSNTLTISNFAAIPDSAVPNDRTFVIVVSDSTLVTAQTSTVSVNLTVQNTDSVPPSITLAPFGRRYTVPLDTANGNTYTDTGKALTAQATTLTGYADNIPVVGGTLQGHVEYAEDDVYNAGVPAVSGQVIFRGKAADNQRIQSLTATITGFNGGAGVGAPFTIATWGTTALNGLTGTGWSFTADASSEGVSQANGHVLNWAFTWDTATHSTVTALGVTVTLTAYDFNGSPATTGAFTVDVVPYVSRIDTGLSGAYKNNPSAFSRTALGHYPVADSETLVLNGFNLNGASTTATVGGVSTGVVVSAPAAVSAGTMIKGFPYTITTVGTTNYTLYGSPNNLVGTSFTATAAGAGTGTVTTVAKHSARVAVGTTVISGVLSVAVAGRTAANNLNDNTRVWNSQSNGLNNTLLKDDLYLDVWKFTNVTSGGVVSTTAKYPTMRISPNAAQNVTFAYGHSESDFRIETNNPGATQLWETSPSKYAWTSLAYDQAATPNFYATAIDTDRSSNGYNTTTSTKFNFFSRQIGSGAAYPGSYVSGTFKRLLEANWNGTQYDSLRSQFPDMVATSPATIVDPAVNVAGNPAKIYLTYYDNLNSQTKFRYGTVGVGGDTIGLGLQEWIGTAHGGVTAPPYSAGFQNEGTTGAPIALSPYVRFASVTAGGNAYYSFPAVPGRTYLVRLYGQTTGTLAANADVYGYQSAGFGAVNASSVLAGTAMETFTMAATGSTIWIRVNGVAATTFALSIQDNARQNEGTIATPVDLPRDTGAYGLVSNGGSAYYRIPVIPNVGYQFRLDNVSAGANLSVYTGADFATGAIFTAGAATPAAAFNRFNGTTGDLTGASTNYLYARVTGSGGAGVVSTFRVLAKEAGTSFGYQEIAGPNAPKKGGQYSAVGVTSTGVAVVAWYDKPNTQLYYSWNTDPGNVNGSSESQWQTNAISLDADFSGWFVSLDVDGADHIHVAYYNSSNGDLRYIYLPTFNGTPTNPVTIDSFLSTGTNVMLKTKLVGSDWVPYIVYYEGALTATKYSMRLAYRTNFATLGDGADPSTDEYTGDWEVGTVPVTNIPRDYEFNLGFKTLGTATNSPILGYATETTLETAQLK